MNKRTFLIVVSDRYADLCPTSNEDYENIFRVGLNERDIELHEVHEVTETSPQTEQPTV